VNFTFSKVRFFTGDVSSDGTVTDDVTAAVDSCSWTLETIEVVVGG